MEPRSRKHQKIEEQTHVAVMQKSGPALRKFMKDHKNNNTFGIAATKRHAYAELLYRRHSR